MMGPQFEHARERRPIGAPVRDPDDHLTPPVDDIGLPEEGGRAYLRRIVVFGSASALLSVAVYVFMMDPGGFVHRLTGWSSMLSWPGLLVYASIAALVIFLSVLLLRYIGLINMAYLNTARYTAAIRNPEFQPAVSIIMPAFNEGRALRPAIESLLRLDYPRFEIIVVDDGSTDDTGAIAEEFIGRHREDVEVRLIQKENGGKATALSAGLAAAKHEYVLCVDGDSRVDPETLRRTVQYMADPRVGAVAGNVKVANRNNVWTKLQALEYIEGLNMVRAAQSVVMLVNLVPGPVGLFRKQAILDAGGYTTDTFAEDCDLTLRLIGGGWRVEYEPGAVSYTEAPTTLPDLLKQRYRWTRGIIQAVQCQRNRLPGSPPLFRATLVTWWMAFESLIWPAMNIFAHLYFIAIAVGFDLSYFLVYWWLSLTILDLIAAFYCVAVEKEEVRLIFYSIIYRLFYILIIDVCKTLAMVEEFLGFGMRWGNLERAPAGAAASGGASA